MLEFCLILTRQFCLKPQQKASGIGKASCHDHFRQLNCLFIKTHLIQRSTLHWTLAAKKLLCAKEAGGAHSLQELLSSSDHYSWELPWAILKVCLCSLSLNWHRQLNYFEAWHWIYSISIELIGTKIVTIPALLCIWML